MLGTGCSLVLQKDLEYWTIGESKEREGWPMPTVETEVNGDSKSTKEKSPSLVGSLVSQVQNTFFLTVHRPHRPATRASSRTGPPIYEYDSPRV